MKHLSQEEKKIRRDEIKKIWVKESVKCYKMLSFGSFKRITNRW